MSRHRVAVMQPYFLPYLGYWQMLASVDEFVVYDTVQYSSGGWINRNRIRTARGLRWITVPLARASHRSPIRDRRITADDGWRATMRRMVASAYQGAPHRDRGIDVLDRLLSDPDRDLAAFLTRSITLVAGELGITTSVRRASCLPAPPIDADAEARVLALCRHLGATEYLNLSGGAALYDASRFRAAGIALKFRVPAPPEPDDSSATDDQSLSILDLLLRHPTDEVRRLVDDSCWTSA